MTQMTMRFNGQDYDPALDRERLTKQIGRIFHLMIDGQWRSLSEIAQATGDHESSISAQLRHLRKPRFGGYDVKKRRRGVRENGLFEYQLTRPVPDNGQEETMYIKPTNQERK